MTSSTHRAPPAQAGDSPFDRAMTGRRPGKFGLGDPAVLGAGVLAAGVLVAGAAAVGIRTASPGRQGEPPAEEAELSRTASVMGTTLSMRLRARDRASALAASEAALRAIERVEARLSTWRETSELSRLNETPPGVPVVLSAALSGDLHAARRWWRETGGAFDPALGALVHAWGIREGGRIPGERERGAARLACGMDGLGLEGNVATRLREGVQLEEGGFGKGRGLDAAREALESSAVKEAILDLGGQVLLVGARGEVSIGVAHPRRRGEIVGTIRIPSGSLATTGDSERGFTIDGRRFSHVLDPRRGRPCAARGSVTVWAPDATAADCLSTALYVMGPDEALRWTERHPGIEVLVLGLGEDGRILPRASRGLRERLSMHAGEGIALSPRPSKAPIEKP